MLLGDLIARFQDERTVNEALLSLDDLTLTARLVAFAADNGMSPGELAVHSVGQFANGASDDEWLALMGQMSGADDPGAVFLRRVLLKAVSA